MTPTNRLFGNISKIYMTTSQSQLFGYCASYNYFPTTHLPIIWLLHIDQLLHHWKSSKYLVTVNKKIVWKLRIAYLETFQRLIWLLRKAQFLAIAHHTIILLLRITQIFVYCKSTNYFNTGNLLHIWLLYVEKLYDNFKSPFWKHINNLAASVF